MQLQNWGVKEAYLVFVKTTEDRQIYGTCCDEPSLSTLSQTLATAVGPLQTGRGKALCESHPEDIVLHLFIVKLSWGLFHKAGFSENSELVEPELRTLWIFRFRRRANVTMVIDSVNLTWLPGGFPELLSVSSRCFTSSFIPSVQTACIDLDYLPA